MRSLCLLLSAAGARAFASEPGECSVAQREVAFEPYMVSSCLERVTSIIRTASMSKVIETVESDYDGHEQPYSVLINISNPERPWRISHPFLDTGEEDGADDILKYFWVIEPLKTGETSMEKGPNVLQQVAEGKLPRAFTSQGPFSTEAGSLDTETYKSYVSLLLPVPVPPNIHVARDVLMLCGFDEHEVVPACH